jgi:hypothetical protein
MRERSELIGVADPRRDGAAGGPLSGRQRRSLPAPRKRQGKT